MSNGKALYRLVFNRKNQLNSEHKALVQIEVAFSRTKRKFISTNVYLKKEEWNASKCLVTSKHPNYINLNALIKGQIDNIEKYELALINEGKPFNKKILDDYLKKGDDKKDNTFISFYRQEMESDNSIKKGTRKEHAYTLSLLTEFKPNKSISEIDYDFVKQFDYFLRNKNLAQNTIHKHHKHILRFLNIASKKGFFNRNNNPYFHFKSKKITSDRLNLTFEEVENIERLEIPDTLSEIINAKDMFLFSCYTGMRYSDMQNLKKSNLISSNEGYSIRFKMEKVTKPIELNLYLLFEGKPQQILMKYMHSTDELIFPQMSNQHVNRQLKLIATSASINKRLTFHISRHTFGTLLADLTANPYLIMDLMGHSDIKTSMIYIHSSQERINRQLRNVNWKFSKKEAAQ